MSTDIEAASGANSGVIVARPTFSKQLDFLLHIIGFAVDISNIWRFPYLCYSYGGGVFLIPYLLMLCIGAAPMFYLELAIGQYHQGSAISIWKICPLFRGIGFTQLMINALVGCYYVVLISWSMILFFQSIDDTLPWMSCGHSFNTKYCATVKDLEFRAALLANQSRYNVTYSTNLTEAPQYLSTTEYFERNILQVQYSHGIDGIGTIQWRIALSSFCIYLFLIASLLQGIKSSGKVVYVTATLPYILLIILLVNGSTLPGAYLGVQKLVVPDFSQLSNADCWGAAAGQVFYALGPGFGVHIAYASYNPRNHYFYRDFIITTVVNAFTSILSAFVIFIYLGYMVQLTGQPFDKVATDGQSLAFTVYPFALGTLPVAPIWSILFFALLAVLGLHALFGGLESILSGLYDNFNDIFEITRYKYARQILTACVGFSFFLLTLSSSTQGGIFVLNLLDRNVAGVSLMFSLFCQAIAVVWCYGMNQLCANVKEMLGTSTGIYLRFCLKIAAPIFLASLVVVGFMSQEPMVQKFGAWHPEFFPQLATMTNFSQLPELIYVYPQWANNVAWCITALPIAFIPLIFLVQVIRYGGFAMAVTPLTEHENVKNGSPNVRTQWRHWLTMGPLDWLPMIRKKINPQEKNSLELIIDEKKTTNGIVNAALQT